MAVFENKSDVESNGGEKKDVARGYVGEDGAVHQEDFATGTSTYAKLQRLAGKFGVEQRGIERVPEDERTNDTLANVGTLVSLNLATSNVGNMLTILDSGAQPTWSFLPLPLACLRSPSLASVSSTRL